MSDLENGKQTVQVGKVLKVLRALAGWKKTLCLSIRYGMDRAARCCTVIGEPPPASRAIP
ncbi:MAG: hypothetical protein R6U13_15340 [Desulfatiglandaceae bacterium]